MTPSEMMSLAQRLYPITRSLTGEGVRETLSILSEIIPLQIHEVPTGTKVFDWTIPKEWNLSDAWIKDPAGKKIVDLADLNLHVAGYSTPVHLKLTLADLLPHLHSVPELPNAVPYRTAYYEEDWGFCISHEQREGLVDGTYEVSIDSELFDGSLTYGEFFHPGLTDQEVLLSCHICHPSLADDNVSGMVVAAAVGRRLAQMTDNRLGVRILFTPGTLGAITWLSSNHDRLASIEAGLTLVCLGDDQPFRYKRTVFGDRSIDRAAALALEDDDSNVCVDFHPFGYDERQYNSPGFRLPIGSLMRSRHGEFPEYHTSLDNLDFIDGGQLKSAADMTVRIVSILQRNRAYLNLKPYGEPQLGRRGLYKSVGRATVPGGLSYAMLWVLNLSDGDHDLIDIASRSQIDFDHVVSAASLLQEHHLLEELE